MFPPERIVCLTEETVETLYLLGEQDRIVGISGYVVRPPQARREKPRVSAFTSADIPKIVALEARSGARRSPICRRTSSLSSFAAGIDVHAFNQRTIAEIFDMIRMLGALVGASARAGELARSLSERFRRRALPPRGCSAGRRCSSRNGMIR